MTSRSTVRAAGRHCTRSRRRPGIDVTYRADINDNAEFYATIRPALESGQDTGHDIIVMSNFQS